jgi:hypothetical protein
MLPVAESAISIPPKLILSIVHQKSLQSQRVKSIFCFQVKKGGLPGKNSILAGFFIKSMALVELADGAAIDGYRWHRTGRNRH